ncbi:hypothetical protein C8T65DRAFT_72799 [Cerioporus squamosus]|nr:hypothetical protein C8T65DRAFT_72799 [Cerioporus squamosus]
MPTALNFSRVGTFAVIRMDPVAMIRRHLNDPEALRAAEALSPRSYLVYLDNHHRLRTWAPKPWHNFRIYPIGPSVRPPNEDECVTSAMCTPIFPNTVHPEGRAPLRTEPIFPFDNCYFWSRVNMEIRVCPRPEGFSRDDVIRLPSGPGGEHIRWLDYQTEDGNQQYYTNRARSDTIRYEAMMRGYNS